MRNRIGIKIEDSTGIIYIIYIISQIKKKNTI